jgi:chromosomal replication initiation ATPase DnaA
VRRYDDILAEMAKRDLLEIMMRICMNRGVPLDQACSAKRWQSLVLARRDMFAYLASELGWSHADIARFFGMHHTSVLDQLKKNP